MPVLLQHDYSMGCNKDWLIVWDGKWNYYLFQFSDHIISRYTHGHMPRNTSPRDAGTARVNQVQYYSTFDNACDNLMRVAVQNSLWPPFLRDVFEKGGI